MKLVSWTNSISCEFDMQDRMKQWLTENELRFIDEKHIAEIGRRADFIVLKPGNGLINIEAKCNDLDCMMSQLKDHSYYCDYSFAFIPDYSMNSKDFKRRLLESGFGLIVYNWREKIITEVLEAHYNNPKLKDVRQKILQYFTGIAEASRQKTIMDIEL